MDRREALQKLAAGGAVAIGGPAIVSSVAFADGGSKPSCRPTPTSASTLTAALNNGNKDSLTITSSTTSFPVTSCPNCPTTPGTATVQFRWQLISAPSTETLWTAKTGGASLTTAFSATSATAVAVTSPVFIRTASGIGNISVGTYVARLTVRYVCTVGTKKYWVCRAFQASVTFDVAGGSDGTITGQTPTTVGPPDNSASCDSPAP